MNGLNKIGKTEKIRKFSSVFIKYLISCVINHYDKNKKYYEEELQVLDKNQIDLFKGLKILSQNFLNLDFKFIIKEMYNKKNILILLENSQQDSLYFILINDNSLIYYILNEKYRIRNIEQWLEEKGGTGFRVQVPY